MQDTELQCNKALQVYTVYAYICNNIIYRTITDVQYTLVSVPEGRAASRLAAIAPTSHYHMGWKKSKV